MWAPRRLVASLLVTTLALAGPLAVPRSCTECPVGCPMHAHDGAGSAAKRQPGCHRAAAAASDGAVCLRSTCGHDVTIEAGQAILALLARPAELASPAPGPRLPTPPLAVACLDAPEPLLRPPRTASA